MNFFNSDLGKIHYIKEGSGNKVLLMLHGLSFTSEIFMSYIGFFKDDYCIIIPDLPGHGQSERLKKLPKTYYLSCADILLNLLAQEKAEKVSIIGISAGAIIALNMAAKAPKLIDKVVADSFPGRKISNGNLDLIIEETKKRSKGILRQMRLKSLQGKDWKSVVENHLNFLESLKFSDHRIVVPDMDKVKCKILLTGSSRYNMVPSLEPVYKKLKDKNPNLKVTLFKTGDHPSFLSNRKRFLLEVQSFLA
jgi:pimeloyl-ACP methyl ester carboxylesterase